MFFLNWWEKCMVIQLKSILDVGTWPNYEEAQEKWRK